MYIINIVPCCKSMKESIVFTLGAGVVGTKLYPQMGMWFITLKNEFKYLKISEATLSVKL